MDADRGPPSPGRRSLLKRGLLGGALLAAGGAGFLALRPGRRLAPPPGGMLVFSEHEAAVLDALARRIVGDVPGWPTVAEVGVVQAVDRIAARAEPSVQAELKQLLGLFDNALAGFLFGGWLRPFTALDPADQDRVLEDWRDSRIALRRTGYNALRTLVLAGYTQSPQTWRPIGYPGPPEDYLQPDAEVWRGGASPRPEGNGVFHPEALR
ncbi:MAG TPA: gluconate 2-dehydrogenase subunit 3 family protein [Myxococcaceae bacterium]|nr:gluconate 2-dehydrogenase subunit 3 family protein [Myxococcaceae bacterium]